MSSTLELCEKLFDTKDVYKLFQIEKTATEKELKKAYYKLSLLVHPDRVPEAQKHDATEKFKLISKLYETLSDKDKRALYDEQGIIDDDDDNLEGKLNNWLELWRKLFKPITTEDINNYEKSYVGSDLEKADIKKAYLNGKGCINYMMNSVPFMKVEDEPRIQEVVRKMIEEEELPEYKAFTQEPEMKRKKRHKKYARESKEAKEILAKIEAKNKKQADAAGSTSLEQAIMHRQKARGEGFSSLLDNLMAKYGNEDDDEAISLEDLGKSRGKKKGQKKSATKKDKDEPQLHTVKNGKVKKR
ncbi:J domain-containing protein CG6693 [Stomoxys calcitrans]|uniref:J domain-containing protein CG6693 n=1 Tax=Stomoxys calcitrans TaxID=35570 RepID=UPI0027E2F751|nr:J domain-containing protein CG6693 [Stomoxys calcitrans]